MKSLALSAALAVIALPALALEPLEPANPSTTCRSLPPATTGWMTSTVQAVFDAAKNDAAHCVWVPAGSYRVTYLNADSIQVVGGGSTSVFYNPTASNRQLMLSGTNVGLYHLKLYTQDQGIRTGEDEAVWIAETAENVVVHDVYIDGGQGPGIISYGAKNVRITANRIYNTNADFIHANGDSQHWYIAGNRVRTTDHSTANTGDDMVAVVKYDDPNYPNEVTRDILIENNDLRNQDWGRGITVVGGRDVTIRNNLVGYSAWACIYIASESSFSTLGSSNVIVQSNDLDHCSRNSASTQPAVLVYSDTQYLVENVYFDDNNITLPYNGDWEIDTQNVQNISCNGNYTDGQPVTPANCTGSPQGVTGATVTSALLGGSEIPMP